MIESLMLVAIGFLIATLFALFALQFVWRRAVSVTTRQLAENLDIDEARSAIEKVASQEIQLHDLRDQQSLLQSQYDEARAQSENQNRSLAELQKRLADTEAAYETEARERAAESARRAYLEEELETLGNRVRHFLNEIGADIDRTLPAPAQPAEAAYEEPDISSGMPEPVEPLSAEAESTESESAEFAEKLSAGVSASEPLETGPEMSPLADSGEQMAPPNDEEHLYAEELAAIKASLAGAEEHEAQGDNKENIVPEHVLAERIRVLEAGVH